ncbi:MAG: Gfo/Idh/MocA family oxidoreductase, partial [Planctomycetales bacterium]|nr:Gfo/Idh/MocA family oxidoreductase [Planctomycetales bacterium]
MSNLKLAVIGAGHLGKIHARLAKELQGAELVAVVEPDAAARAAVAEAAGVPGYAHHSEVLGQIDAAIVAAPTRFHHRVALDLLQADKHVLVEKPI